MDSEHTPGPWKAYDPHDSPCMSYCSPNGCSESHPSGMRCVEGPPVPDEIRFENIADALLVAAAPDLLEALAELVDLMEAVRSGEYRPDSFTTQPARAAIAKAKGEHVPPIEASQAGGQLPDVVQVPREVYEAVLDRLDSFLKYIIPSGYAYDEVVREHERLKMCGTTAERGVAGG